MKEIWKDIEGTDGKYRVSNLGHVLSVKYRGGSKEKMLVPKENNSGRLWVEIVVFGKRSQRLIHRLVADAFIENPNNYNEVNHKDENPKNNSVCNLEWCDRKYNVSYYFCRHRDVWENRKESQKYKRQNDKKVFQRLPNGQLVREWENSRTIANETGMSDWSISECCRGKRKTAYGYIWSYSS